VESARKKRASEGTDHVSKAIACVAVVSGSVKLAIWITGVNLQNDKASVDVDIVQEDNFSEPIKTHDSYTAPLTKPK
jgi:hypothetical protein